MTLYELLLALHIFAAIIWLGAGFVLAVLVFGAERAANAAKAVGYHQDVAWLSARLFIPASLSVFVIGILLVLEGSWNFDQLWIVIGMAGWLVSFLIGILYFKPESERVDDLVAAHGPGAPEVEARVGRVTAVERFELAILFLVAGDMAVKPTGEDTVVLVVGAAIVIGGALYALSALRRPLAAAAA
jgi:uncharacterized membrane protein